MIFGSVIFSNHTDEVGAVSDDSIELPFFKCFFMFLLNVCFALLTELHLKTKFRILSGTSPRSMLAVPLTYGLNIFSNFSLSHLPGM